MSDKPAEGEVQQIDISTLPLDQLNFWKNKVEEECEHLVNQFGNLKVGLNRFETSEQCLNALAPENAGKQVMVPLTGSLYVMGDIASIESVLVDIGTGYYAEKSIPKAKDYFGRRLSTIKENMDLAARAISEKRKTLNILSGTIEGRVRQAAMAAKQ